MISSKSWPGPEHWRLLHSGLLLATALAMVTLWTLPPLYVAGAAAAIAVTLLTLRYPPAALALVALSVPWGSGHAVRIGPFPLTSTDLLIALVCAVWLASSVSYRRNPFTPLWTPFLLVFICIAALSSTQGTDHTASYREVLKWLEVAGIYGAATFCTRTRRDVRLIASAIVVAGVSQAVLGFAQFFSQTGPAAFGLHRAFFRSYGSFDQPNPYAGYLNMVLPLAVALALGAETPRRRAVYGASAVALGGAVLASQSRGAFLAAIVALTLMTATRSAPAARILRLAASVPLGLGFMATWNLLPQATVNKVLSAVGLGNVSFDQVNDANFSAVERAAHWLAGVRMFQAHPFLGVGIGNYAAAYPAFHPRGWYASLEHAHNYYINIAAEAGLFGLVAYLFLQGSALWYTYTSFRQERDSLLQAILLGVLGALLATSVHNVFDVLYVHGMAALLGLLLSLVPVSRALMNASPQGSEHSTFTGAIHA